MVGSLVQQLTRYPEISQIIVVENIPENLALPNDPRVQKVVNLVPMGFASNHNASFRLMRADYFCVLNPDIIFKDNLFPGLLMEMKAQGASLIAPIVLNKGGELEDSARHFPTFKSLLKKIIFKDKGAYDIKVGGHSFSPDWVAGMFLLFDKFSFSQVNGFDEKYFLYYEDVDICSRLWRQKFKIILSPKSIVIHDARRDSQKSMKFAFLHIKSMARYLLSQLMQPNILG